jgi:phosphate transport system substrate-binding protein
MVRAFGAVAVVVLGLALAAGCDKTPPPRQAVVLSGSRSMMPLLRDIAARFTEGRPDVRINIEPTSSDRALIDTRQGVADIGMLGRALRPDETGLRGHVLARDGLAVVVHRSNPVRGLSSSRVATLFSRGYGTWKELGGSDRPIKLVGMSEGRSTREVFLEHFNLNRTQVAVDIPVGTSEQAVEAVAQTPTAVGYASLGAALAAGEAAVRALPLDGEAATLDNVQRGDYPLIRSLLLLTREPPPDAAKAFLEFARSAAVHDLVRKHGFVPAGQ